MTTPITGDPLALRPHSGGRVRLTADTVRHLEFSRAPLGRRGYTEADVERFRIRVIDEINTSDAQMAELRARIERLRAFVMQHNLGPIDGPSVTPDQVVPSEQAVNVLSQAQQVADQHIAQAVDYARHLIADARQRYEQILAHAHRQAAQTAEP